MCSVLYTYLVPLYLMIMLLRSWVCFEFVNQSSPFSLGGVRLLFCFGHWASNDLREFPSLSQPVPLSDR